jgi:vacuolar-type H+-ATPase subunit F/Vma7
MFTQTKKNIIRDFNIQTNPYFDIKNKSIRDNNLIKSDNSLENDNIDDDIDDDIENEEYLDITSDDVVDNELQTSAIGNKVIYYGENLINPGIVELTDKDYVYLFIYKINTSGLKPFIEICLYKMSNEELNLPYYKWMNYKTPFELREKLKATFKHYTNDITYKGYFNSNSKTYLFYNLSHLDTIHEYSNTNPWIWTTIDEIVNKQSIYDIVINKEIYEFIIKNTEFCYLEDVKGNFIEIPTVAYYKADKERKNIIVNVGIIKKQQPYYTFYTYNELKSQHKEDTNSFLIRFCLFLGNTFVELHKSKVSSDIQNDTHEKIWIETYDSYVKTQQFKKVNNKLEQLYPYYIVKHNNQFIPLSYF